MTHVHRARHAEVLHRIAGWLRSGGYLLLTLSASGQSDGMQDDFCGVPMYFSGFGPETNRDLLHATRSKSSWTKSCPSTTPSALSSSGFSRDGLSDIAFSSAMTIVRCWLTIRDTSGARS